MKKMEKALIAVMLSSTLFVTGVSFAQQNRNQNGNANSSNRNTNGNMMSSGANMGSGMMSGNTIGNVSMDEFKRLNDQGAAAVAAITPTSTPLSEGDQKLMMQVAMGGLMQLEVSRAALQKVSSPEARLLAQSEVEEQTGLAAKLREIAGAKGVTLPQTLDSKGQRMVTKMQGMTAGADFDRTYIRESGIKGHEQLDKTMSRVQSRAADDNLKSLAGAALPLVRLHLQVSRAELSEMTGSGGGRRESGSTSGNTNSNTNSNR